MSGLFGGTAPFVAGSDTSEAAALEIEEGAETLRRRVFAFVRSRGAWGATDEEAQIALGMAGNTERPRRRELELQGRVRDSGLRRLTTSRRAAVVWVAT